jgi:hypothetical protein
MQIELIEDLFDESATMPMFTHDQRLQFTAEEAEAKDRFDADVYLPYDEAALANFIEKSKMQSIIEDAYLGTQ